MQDPNTRPRGGDRPLTDELQGQLVTLSRQLASGRWVDAKRTTKLCQSLAAQVAAAPGAMFSQGNATDPRRPGGTIVDPEIGDQWSRRSVAISTDRAVLLDNTHVAMIEPHSGGQAMPPQYAMTLSGRINRSDDHAHVLFLFDADGAAAITTELIALANRMGPTALQEFTERFEHRMDQLQGGD